MLAKAEVQWLSVKIFHAGLLPCTVIQILLDFSFCFIYIIIIIHSIEVIALFFLFTSLLLLMVGCWYYWVDKLELNQPECFYLIIRGTKLRCSGSI